LAPSRYQCFDEGPLRADTVAVVDWPSGSCQPSSQSKRVEPQRRHQERLEKPLALRRVEPRPALHRRLGQISAPHLVNLKSEIQQRKIGKRKTQIC
jgi:hypothetical protein